MRSGLGSRRLEGDCVAESLEFGDEPSGGAFGMVLRLGVAVQAISVVCRMRTAVNGSLPRSGLGKASGLFQEGGERRFRCE